MTTIRKNPINAGNFANFGEPKINKRYEIPAVESLNSQPESKPDNPNRVTFEKPEQVLFDSPVPSTESETPAEPEMSDAERRAARRAEWKDAEKIRQRALQMEKEAKAKLAQAQRFEEISKKAHENPVEVARALGMTPEEFLRKYQNQMFNIPEEPQPKPEEDVKTRLERYEEERRREKEEYQKMQSDMIRNNYIATKILPVVTGDKERFELLNLNGLEQCAGFIYDFMNNYYMQHGEELNPLDVADEMENQLTKEFEDRIAKTRVLKKFSKHFRTDTDAPGQEVTLPNQLGEGQDLTSEPPIQVRTSAQDNQANGPAQLGSGPNTLTDTKLSQNSMGRKTISNPMQTVPSANENSYQRQASWDRKRESRLERLNKGLKV